MKSSLAMVTLVLLLSAGSATAQIARVFLAGTGNDANDCSVITTPCRSLQAAINQCPAHGEVIVITSGGFGTAAITKSVTVDAAPGVLAFNARMMTVTIAPTDIVTLRHLTINGAVFGDLTGISFNSGGTLNLEHCDIGGFANYGIFQGGAGSSLTLTECAVHDTTIGIYTGPLAAAAATVALAHCSIHNTTNVAFWVNSSGTATVTDSEFTDNHFAIRADSDTASTKTAITVNRCMISGSSGIALDASATNSGLAVIYVSNSSINTNATPALAVTGSGGTARVVSYGNNAVANNTFSGPFTITGPTT